MNHLGKPTIVTVYQVSGALETLTTRIAEIPQSTGANYIDFRGFFTLHHPEKSAKVIMSRGLSMSGMFF